VTDFLYSLDPQDPDIGGLSSGAGFDYTFFGGDLYVLSEILCLDDASFVSILSMNHQILQGVTLNFTGKVPLDRKVFSGNEPGKLGPEKSRANCSVSFKVSLRF
jgi:hypothetical protein